MSNQQGQAGYRGALPPRNDRLAAPWVIVVIAIFVLMIVLSFLGLPSSLFPAETPVPLPSASVEASASAAPSGSAEASGSIEPSASASAEPSTTGSTEQSAEASASAEPGSAAPSATGSP
jgi:hypothetical protein